MSHCCEPLLELVFDFPQVLLELHSQLLCFGDSYVLSSVSTLQTSFNVNIVVLDDPENDVRG